MNVTPMNLQMVFPQANEATQVQHNLNQAAALQQSFEDLRKKEDAKLKQQQVRTKDNPEDGRIRDDQQGRGGGYAASGRRQRSDEDEEQPQERYASDPSRGHFLDISY